MIRYLSSSLIATLTLAAAGCSAPMVLQKYVAVAPQQETLAGKRIHIVEITNTTDLDLPWEESEPTAVEYEYRAPSAEQLAEWQAAVDAPVEVDEEALHRLGWHRNLYGMPVRDIFSRTPPAEWLGQALRAELAAQGVEVVTSAADADLTVTATIEWLRIELFSTKNIWADLVVGFEIAVPGAEPEKVRLHTRGKAAAWLGSAEEGHEALSRAEQQMEHLLMAALGERVAESCECKCR